MILDSDGRPFRKNEFEEFSHRISTNARLMSAENFFAYGGSAGQHEDDIFGGRFVVASDDGFFRNKDTEYSDGGTWSQGGLVSNSPYASINQRFAHKNPISSLNVPRDTKGLMTISMQYATENYIVSKALRVKRNFALREFQICGSKTQTEFYTKELRRLKFRKVLSHTFRHYWSTGRVVVWWGKERPIQRMSLLDPRYIIVRGVLGRQIVFLMADPRWKEILEAAKVTSPKEAPEAHFLKKNLPREWIPFIERSQPIPLEEGSYSLIENDLELFSPRGINSPSNLPLEAIFPQLASMEMMVAGDFSIAWMMKHMMVLVSIGDPQREKNYTRPDQTELDKLQAQFQRPDPTFWAYVDPTVDVRFIAPDPKMFDQAKYKQLIESIEYHMGVPAIFSRMGDSNFASGSISLKSFREEITVGRQDIEAQLLADLFPVLREGATSKRSGGGNDPSVSWDQDCLKDDTILMQELQGKYDRGAVSIHSLLAGKAQDYDTELALKESEQDQAKVWQPLWDMNHGTDVVDREAQIEAQTNPEGTPGKPGRPTTSSQPQSEKGNTPTPRPSKNK